MSWLEVNRPAYRGAGSGAFRFLAVGAGFGAIKVSMGRARPSRADSTRPAALAASGSESAGMGPETSGSVP